MNGLAGNTYGIEGWATYSITDWWRLKPGVNWLHKNLTVNPGATDFSQLQAAGQDPPYQAQLRSEMNISSTVEFDTTVRGVGRVSRSNVPPMSKPMRGSPGTPMRGRRSRSTASTCCTPIISKFTTHRPRRRDTFPARCSFACARASEPMLGAGSVEESLLRLLLGSGIAALIPSTPSPAQESGSLERAIKATYLWKFAPFVEWPASAFKSPDSPFVICILGGNPFGNLLDEAVAGQRILGRPISIRHLSGVSGNSGCQILFDAGSPEQTIAAGLQAVRGTPVLTVTDSAGQWRPKRDNQFRDRGGPRPLRDQRRDRVRKRIGDKLETA